MIFTALDLPGAYLVDPEPIGDARGSFARAFCADTFAAHGLEPVIRQINLSHNARAGTLRGLHLQRAPHAEAKLVRCARGRLVDIVVDVRAGSPTFGRHVAVELSGSNGRQIYVPKGCAHGFQTLEDATDVVYCMSTDYVAAAQAGIRFDDPDLALPWPDRAAAVVSDRDRGFPAFRDFTPEPGEAT